MKILNGPQQAYKPIATKTLWSKPTPITGLQIFHWKIIMIFFHDNLLQGLLYTLTYNINHLYIFILFLLFLNLGRWILINLLIFLLDHNLWKLVIIHEIILELLIFFHSKVWLRDLSTLDGCRLGFFLFFFSWFWYIC